MAAVISTTAPARRPSFPVSPTPGHGPALAPARPPLQVIPGGRRAARAYARDHRTPVRLHPAVYRRRRLGALLVTVTVVGIAILALTGARTLLAGEGAAARPGPSAATPAAEPAAAPPAATYVVGPGDTLWSIARSLRPTGEIRPLVDELASRVGSAPLVVGQAVPIDGLVG